MPWNWDLGIAFAEKYHLKAISDWCIHVLIVVSVTSDSRSEIICHLLNKMTPEQLFSLFSAALREAHQENWLWERGVFSEISALLSITTVLSKNVKIKRAN